MAKPRVHEIASEMGVSSKDAMLALRDLGEMVRGPSSSIEPPVARKLRAFLEGKPPRDSSYAVLNDRDGNAAVLEALRRGASGAPEALDLLAGRATSRQEAALADFFDRGVLFYVPLDASPDVLSAGESPLTLGFAELPAPKGVIVLATEDSGRWEVTGWSSAFPDLEVLTINLVLTRAGVVRSDDQQPRRILGADSRWAGIGKRNRIIGGVYRTMPRRPAPSPASRHNPPPLAPQPGDHQVHVVAATLPPLELMAGRQTELRPRTEPGYHRQGRWPVRGHWRRQWYARAGEHRRIWIADHTAGEADGQLRDRTMVYVVRGEGSDRPTD